MYLRVKSDLSVQISLDIIINVIYLSFFRAVGEFGSFKEIHPIIEEKMKRVSNKKSLSRER